MPIKQSLITALSLPLALMATNAQSAGECAIGKTIQEGTLTIATGNPAYYPWVLNNDPAAGEGFEAAVAIAIAQEMGFSGDKVSWTTASFDQSIQPGPKDFDFNLQQFSITDERDQVVDFSIPYYSAAMAVLTRQPVIDNGAKASLASLKGLLFGIAANTTGLAMVQNVIQPGDDPLLYDDNANVVEAMKANQIDAGIFDLPTALYLSAVTLDDGVILGQFPSERSDNPDQFGLLMQEGNPLKECVDMAINAIIEDGSLAEIEAQWLQETTGVPVIQ